MTADDVDPAVAVYQRCRCWQYGRCLSDCPSAEQDAPTSLWWDRRENEWIPELEASARDFERAMARNDDQ